MNAINEAKLPEKHIIMKELIYYSTHSIKFDFNVHYCLHHIMYFTFMTKVTKVEIDYILG